MLEKFREKYSKFFLPSPGIKNRPLEQLKKIKLSPPPHELKQISNTDIYKPSRNPSTRPGFGGYTITPYSPLQTAFSCTLTTLKYTSENENKYITFDEFSVQINENGLAPSDYGHVNQCVGFLSGESILCIFSLLLVLGISMFAGYMLMGIDTMDKFEDPKMRPLTVPLEAGK